MSVLHAILGPGLGQAGWEAAHTVENGTVTAAMLDAAYQPLDSDLTAIAALSTTAYGRAFLALANAAAARTALALGTAAVAATGDFDAAGAAAAAQSASQPVDSDLTAIAALATTSFGRGLLTSADAAALRTSAGLGTLATQSGTFSGTSSGTNTGDQTLSDATISTTDITTNNVSTSKHGFAPKAPNVATQYLDGTGAYSTPASGGVSVPNVVQIVCNGNGATTLTVAAAAAGHSFILFTNSTTGQISAVSCTNVTWTAIKQANDGTGFMAVWVGVVAGGSSGTTITMTKPGSFNSAVVMEVVDTLTPTAGATTSVTTAGPSATVAPILRLSGTTAGRLIVFGQGMANTALVTRIAASGATVGLAENTACAMLLGYSLSSAAIMSFATVGASGVAIIAEVT